MSSLPLARRAFNTIFQLLWINFSTATLSLKWGVKHQIIWPKWQLIVGEPIFRPRCLDSRMLASFPTNMLPWPWVSTVGDKSDTWGRKRSGQWEIAKHIKQILCSTLQYRIEARFRGQIVAERDLFSDTVKSLKSRTSVTVCILLSRRKQWEQLLQ